MSARIGRVFSVTVTTALYRRYRPDSFADVIGQEHVTGPLMTALRKNRVNHAYLFSGPRGCGKTTSARILARALNCEQAPVADPCGVCDSCRDLARGGPGSIDVIEIDAASHGGVDDARDLREKAFFAPVRDRSSFDPRQMMETEEFPGWGGPRYLEPALKVTRADGSLMRNPWGVGPHSGERSRAPASSSTMRPSTSASSMPSSPA